MTRKTATKNLVFHVGEGGRTIQDAVNEIMRDWDLRGYSAKIKVADGVYADRIQVSGLPVGSTRRPAIVIEGNIKDPSQCFVEVKKGHAFENFGGHVEITGFKFSAEGCGILGHDTGHTTIGSVEFGDAGGDQILGTRMHVIRHASDYTISGNGRIHAHVIDGAIYSNGRTITLVGCPHFSEEFHGVKFAKSMWAGTRFIGVATGVRHLIHFNSVCAIGGANPELFFPGDKPGEVSNFSSMM
jgi:hypothetical protein